jgi:hypothetical protein
MIVTPIDHGITLNRSAPGYVRSPGLHASQIYNDLYASLDPKRYGGTTGPNPLHMELGLGLEEGMEESLKRRWGAERPGEFTTADGIIYTPDFLCYKGESRLGEIKLTYMSSRGVPRETGNGFPGKFDKYMTQIMFYCHSLETCHATLLTFFVNGAGNFSGPELLGWDITFTARELQDNQQMLRNHARHKGWL